MAVVADPDAVFSELKVALGRRRHGAAGAGWYVARQQQPQADAEPPCHSNRTRAAQRMLTPRTSPGSFDRSWRLW